MLLSLCSSYFCLVYKRYSIDRYSLNQPIPCDLSLEIRKKTYSFASFGKLSINGAERKTLEY